MKQRIFTFLLIALAGFSACKKLDDKPNIQVYDDQQIQQYLSAGGLTGFTKDNATGMYYKIIKQGSGDTVKYQDDLSLVYTVKTMDGKYNLTDTITNHYYGYLGQLKQANSSGFRFPEGLQLAIHDLLKYKDASIRVMIPSNLAYGVNGFGSGSASNVNTLIAGNQSLDYYVHVIGKQDVYDDLCIRNYMTAKGLTGYTKDPLGYYYKIVTPGTGAAGEIKEFSNVSLTYVGTLLNDAEFDNASKTTATTFVPYSLTSGFKDALMKHAVTGTSLSLFIPSGLAYGGSSQSGVVTVPSYSVLHFELQVSSVTQP